MRIISRVSLIVAMLPISIVISASAVKAQSLPQLRMTPAEVRASITGGDSNRVGSAGLEGVHTKVLFGNPEKAGYYSILLSVGPHTTIQAHSHRDDRVATVVSGEWHFGYGDHFDAKLLKALPPGSVYSEPGGKNHFAQTEDTPVIVEISGYGPTNTVYFNPADDPISKPKK
jgi:quercetin dioxygenase-like cupin family protein